MGLSQTLYISATVAGLLVAGTASLVARHGDSARLRESLLAAASKLSETSKPLVAGVQQGAMSLLSKVNAENGKAILAKLNVVGASAVEVTAATMAKLHLMDGAALMARAQQRPLM